MVAPRADCLDERGDLLHQQLLREGGRKLRPLGPKLLAPLAPLFARRRRRILPLLRVTQLRGVVLRLELREDVGERVELLLQRLRARDRRAAQRASHLLDLSGVERGADLVPQQLGHDVRHRAAAAASVVAGSAEVRRVVVRHGR
jgi:hypothetical protein